MKSVGMNSSSKLFATQHLPHHKGEHPRPLPRPVNWMSAAKQLPRFCHPPTPMRSGRITQNVFIQRTAFWCPKCLAVLVRPHESRMRHRSLVQSSLPALRSRFVFPYPAEFTSLRLNVGDLGKREHELERANSDCSRQNNWDCGLARGVFVRSETLFR